VHLQEDLLHDVFEIRPTAQHALSQARYVLPVRAKQLSERLGIATLAALDEAWRFHALEFNSGWPCWLALEEVSPPRGDIGHRVRRGRKH
jgi:hypothetical protein